MPPHAGRPFAGKIGEKAGHFSVRMKLIPAIMHVEGHPPHTRRPQLSPRDMMQRINDVLAKPCTMNHHQPLTQW
jgi:hypothetical protein